MYKIFRRAVQKSFSRTDPIIMIMYKMYYNLILICFVEMVEAMKNVAGLDVELTVEERNLLSVAYKNVIGKDLIVISK